MLFLISSVWFSKIREWKCFGRQEQVREALASIPADQNASNCNECGDCEEACPNDVPVREALKELEKVMP